MNHSFSTPRKSVWSRHSAGESRKQSGRGSFKARGFIMLLPPNILTVSLTTVSSVCYCPLFPNKMIFFKNRKFNIKSRTPNSYLLYAFRV